MGASLGSLGRVRRAVALSALAGLALLVTLGQAADRGAGIVSAQLVPGTPTPTGTPTLIGTLTLIGTPTGTASPGPAGLAGPGLVPQTEPAGPTLTPTPTPTATVDLCYGDEQILFAPDTPRIGSDLVITVSSAHPHPYGRLAGTERTTFVREHPGQLGTVWEWTVSPTAPGEHEYTYYVDSTIPCAKVRLRVQQALGSVSTSSSSGDNGSGDNNSGDNGSGDNGSVTVVVVTATPEPSLTPTPTATNRAP